MKIASRLRSIVTYNQSYLNQLRQCSCVHENVQRNPLIFQEGDVHDNQKLLHVAVIGMPNAGKSTFINYLMDRKVCPTSSKVHTTRTKAKAIFTEGDSQIIFLDTPGLVTDRIKRRFNLENSFIADSLSCLKQADTIGVIHDASNVWEREKLDIKIIKLLEKYQHKPSFLVLNKVDVLKSKRKLLELTRLLTMDCIAGKPNSDKPFEQTDIDNRGWPYFKEVFMVSALTGTGLQEVRDHLISTAQPGKWLYPVDTWSDQTPENIILSTVKAALLDFLPQEIPYQLQPIMELFETSRNGTLHTVVLVKCTTQRLARLIAGASDGKLRQITQRTQRDLEDVFQQNVNIRIVLDAPRENDRKK